MNNYFLLLLLLLLLYTTITAYGIAQTTVQGLADN